jgi:hypothetical protein
MDSKMILKNRKTTNDSKKNGAGGRKEGRKKKEIKICIAAKNS